MSSEQAVSLCGDTPKIYKVVGSLGMECADGLTYVAVNVTDGTAYEVEDVHDESQIETQVVEEDSMSTTDYLWPKEIVKRLVELWEERPVLYDVTNDRTLRRRAVNEIAEILKKPPDQVNRKMSILRAQFIRHKRRIDDSRKSSGGEEEYKPSWPLYTAMQFLQQAHPRRCFSAKRPKTEPQTPTPEEEEGVEEEEATVKTVVKPDEITITIQRKGLKRGWDLDNDSIMQKSSAICDALINKRRVLDCEDYGRHIARELSNMPLDQRRLLQLKIDTLIYESTPGVLSHPTAIAMASDSEIQPSQASFTTDIPSVAIVNQHSYSLKQGNVTVKRQTPMK